MILLFMCIVTSITFAQNYKFGKVSKAELEEKYYSTDSTASAAYLYKKRSTYYEFRNGAKLITDVVQRIKIYNKEGFDYASLIVDYYKSNKGASENVSSIKGYVYNIVDGKVEEIKLSKKNIFDEKLTKTRRQKKITMPNIKEGTVIEIKYRLTSPFYQSIDDLQFQYNIPIKNLDYSVSIPEYFKFNKRAKGYYFIPMKTSKKNGSSGGLSYSNVVSLFKAQNVPALKDDEPFVSNINNYRSGIIFELTGVTIPGEIQKYFSNTWKDVAKTIYKSSSFGSELKKTSYFKDDLNAVLAKVNSPNEKIVAIFNHVKNKVKWNGNYGIGASKGVKKAYKEGIGNVGDVNLMLVSMLRNAGLDANPVLISTRNNGISLFPTIDGFNYVIASVALQGKNILLDASEKFSTPNVLPLRTVNWQGRIIKEDLSSDWISLLPTVYSGSANFMSVSLNDEFELSGMMRTTYKNLEALDFRKNKNHLKNEGLINSLEEKYGIEIEEYKIANKNKLYKPITRVIKFFGEDFTETINGKIYISPLLFLKNTENPFKLKERKFPIDYGVPIKNKSSISIKLPKGYKVESLPEKKAIALSNNAVVFGYKVISKDSKISVVSQFQVNSPIITPEYYQELKELYNQMVKKQSEKIVLIKE